MLQMKIHFISEALSSSLGIIQMMTTFTLIKSGKQKSDIEYIHLDGLKLKNLYQGMNQLAKLEVNNTKPRL